MLSCECGYVHHLQPGERSVSTLPCPKCGRTIRKSETWIMPIGNLNPLEAKKFQGEEERYLKQRKLKNGY